MSEENFGEAALEQAHGYKVNPRELREGEAAQFTGCHAHLTGRFNKVSPSVIYYPPNTRRTTDKDRRASGSPALLVACGGLWKSSSDCKID